MTMNEEIPTTNQNKTIRLTPEFHHLRIGLAHVGYSFSCNIISVTIHAVKKSPHHVPVAAAFMKTSLLRPRYVDIRYGTV
uniref:Uncharacterized protein n=1 Tax=Arion vulgaris TaxID=1028688 RepID=A0A0B6Y2X4_9EUPU